MSKYGSKFSPNAGKYGPQKTSYLDTFHAVFVRQLSDKNYQTWWECIPEQGSATLACSLMISPEIRNLNKNKIFSPFQI